MDTLDYMKSQLEKAKLTYKITKNKKNVTQRELSELESKIRYYETAVNAMERSASKNDRN